MSASLRVGTCGWADKTLVECGRFYAPDVAGDPKKRLAFYAQRFDLVELDASFYAIPQPAVAAGWAAQTPPGFLFDVKAYGLLTGHRTNPKSLPPDLRAAVPEDALAKGAVYPRDLHPGLMGEVYARFEAALRPLEDAHKLGVVLFQYPPWFGPTPASKQTLEALRARLPRFEIAVEFRNGSWLAPRERERTLSLLRSHALDYVCVDEPQGFPSSVPPIVAVTGRTAIVRFHGRNRDTWTKKLASAAERMNWDYSKEELAEWLPRIGELREQAKSVHLLMNNCHEDKAVRSATRLAELLELPLGVS